MALWAFYGRDEPLAQLHQLIAAPRWFFCRIQGRRRIGKTALLTRLAQLDARLASRFIYVQIPDSDERDVTNTFARMLRESDLAVAQQLASSITDFARMAAAIGVLCRSGAIVVLDEFQYFTRSTLRPFSSFLESEVDTLRDSTQGGLFVLGSIRAEMTSLLDDTAAPLYGRLTARIDLTHWDFQDLLHVFRAHDLRDPYQWLTLWSFFEGVPKFYRDAFEQGLFDVPPEQFQRELLRRMFLMSSSPLTEEADTWFLREFRGRAHSILTYIAGHPGCTNGDVTSALADGQPRALGAYLVQLTKSFGLVERLLPVFANSVSRSARYYVTDNFLQAWLAVAKPARESARLKPIERAIAIAIPRLETHEGATFEKLIRHLHVECSRKGVGDFELSQLNLGYWNRPRDAARAIEIDVVALDEDNERVRFGSCKRSSSKHDTASLAGFDHHISAFLATADGKKLATWTHERVLFAPRFSANERKRHNERGFACRDLNDYASFLGGASAE